MPTIEIPALRIEFRGRDADQHMLDVRELGESLKGFGGLLGAASYMLPSGEMPPRHFAPSIRYYARPPQHGCFPIDIVGHIFADMFQSSSQIFATVGQEAVQRIVSAAFLLAGGRDSEVDAHIAKILDLMNQIEADRHEEQMALLKKWSESEEHLRSVLEMFSENQRGNLESASAPIGKSSNEARVGDVDNGGVVIDIPTAETIRSRTKLRTGELQAYRVLVDGITVHNRTIGVYLESDLQAPIRGDLADPAADEWPNIYQNNVLGFLEIIAKPSLDKEERIRRLTVMDAKQVSENDVSEELRNVAREISESRRSA
ncbi:MAG: hypothetical protein OXE57_05485 [Alphaproteobacteria bacterium]|nr:hypothetical protein [Alphaproteobacteria bacterium]